MPDPLLAVLSDPANRLILAATVVGLVVVLLGPWAIVRVAARGAGRAPRP